MDEGRIEQLEKMFPDGFIIIVPRRLAEVPLPLWIYYSNPRESEGMEQVVDDIVFALDKDSYWEGGKKKSRGN